MRYISMGEILVLHDLVIAKSGGMHGVRDEGALESALAQPRMTFDGEDLYPTVVEKAAALLYSLVMNHPFVDGNKRTGHAAMDAFLRLNGYSLHASAGLQEQVILHLAAGRRGRDELAAWLRGNIYPA